MSKKRPIAERDALLVEYQAAQESAQHHDNQVWTTTGIIWGAGLVLIGFVVQILDKRELMPIIVLVSVLALFMLVHLWIMAFQFNSIKRQKYDRCKEIENLLHLHQHTDLIYKVKTGRTLYCITMILYVIVWLLIIAIVIFPKLFLLVL